MQFLIFFKWPAIKGKNKLEKLLTCTAEPPKSVFPKVLIYLDRCFQIVATQQLPCVANHPFLRF